MTKLVVQEVVYWLRALPTDSEISNTLSPSAIVIGTPKIDFKHLKLTFGSYAQLHPGTRNTTKTMIVVGIALRRLKKTRRISLYFYVNGKAYNLIYLD